MSTQKAVINAAPQTPVVKYTRADYMGRKVSHQEYYGQFVTAGVLQNLWNTFGEEIVKSLDPYFNDIKISRFDVMGLPAKVWNAYQTAESNSGSPAGRVCILKAGCAILRDELAPVEDFWLTTQNRLNGRANEIDAKQTTVANLYRLYNNETTWIARIVRA